jgi:hypothetical protein
MSTFWSYLVIITSSEAWPVMSALPLAVILAGRRLSL